MKSHLIHDHHDPQHCLRQQADPVMDNEFKTPYLKTILQKMDDALASREDGVAIAAPQIGVSKRIFVIAAQVFADAKDNVEVINPTLIKNSRNKVPMHEGCLSVKNTYGTVDRFEKATIRAFDRDGREFTMGGSGLLAQIFQHEIDHLNGVLFIDKAYDVEDKPPATEFNQKSS